MNCDQVRNNLLAYLDGETSPGEAKLIRAHLQDCRACRADLDGQAALQGWLKAGLQARAASVSPSGRAWPGLRARTGAVATISRPAPRAWLRWAAPAGLFLLLSTFMILACVPSARAQVYNILRLVVLGEYSDAAQVDSLPAQTSQPVPADTWIVHTEIGNFGGNAAPGQDPRVLTYSDLAQAQASIDAPILSPTYLPDGYRLKEVKIAPMSGEAWVYLFYTGPGGEIVIAQLPGGPQPVSQPNQVSAIKTGILTNGTLEEVDFDGRKAVWLDGRTLGWADGSTTYEVGGKGLSLAEAMEIARSLH